VMAEFSPLAACLCLGAVPLQENQFRCDIYIYQYMMLCYDVMLYISI
jgi:hypothetical protein